jgi:hypothetical protein
MAQRDKLIATLERQIDQQSADLVQWKTKADVLTASGRSGGEDPQAVTAENSRLVQ